MTLKKIIGIVSVVIAAAIGSAIGGGMMDGLFGGSSDGISDRVLAQEADKLNRNLPMMVDSETQLVTTSGANNTFHYNYKMVNFRAEQIDTAYFKEAIKKQVANNYCTHPDMKTFRDNGVTLHYNYSDRDDRFITTVVVKAEECIEG